MTSRSPTAATPLPKSSSVPQSPWKELPPPSASPNQPVPFPPPQTFDFLPQLHGLLLRLLAPPTNSGGPSSGRVGEDAAAPSGPSTAGPSQTQQPQENNNVAPQVAPGTIAAEIAALGPNAPPPLDAKDLPTEASSIKIRIQKAQAVVDGLPDVHRSVEDQELEIDELEDRIAKLKSAISEFGRRAGT